MGCEDHPPPDYNRIADCRLRAQHISTARVSDRLGYTYVESMEEHLCDVTGNGDVREVALRSSSFIAVIDKSVNQPLYDREK